MCSPSREISPSSKGNNRRRREIGIHRYCCLREIIVRAELNKLARQNGPARAISAWYHIDNNISAGNV